MKISAVPSVANVAATSIDANGNPPQGSVERYRSLKMTTNATPLMNQMGPNPIAPISNEAQTVDEATQPLSPQLALLAKQRRALQREREQLNKQRSQLSQSNGTSMIDAARLKSEPLSVLLEHGVTYDQLTQAILSGDQGNSEIDALKAELNALKTGIDQKFLDKETAAEQQVLAEMKREAEQLVRGNDDYELVRELGHVPSAMKLVERTYRETGEILDVPEALRLVEEELFKENQRVFNFKKMQRQMQGQMAPQFQPQQRQTGMRTLTNRDTASVPLSAKARAMAAFYGTLQRR